MKIPGFDAEASIYKSPEHYASQTASSGSSQPLVQPAVNYGCIVACLSWCPGSGILGCSKFCRELCKSGAGGGGI